MVTVSLNLQLLLLHQINSLLVIANWMQ